MSEIRYFEDVNEGDEMEPLVKDPIGRVQLARYAGASGDFNPIHLDDDFAKRSGLPNGVIAHGMLSMGFAGQYAGAWAAGGKVKKIGVRFTAMTDLHDVVACKGKVVKKWREEGENLVQIEYAADTTATEGKDGVVTIQGQAVVALQSKS